MGITSQGYPTSTFSVYRKENINLSIVAVGRTFEHFVDVGSVVADAGLVVGRARAVRKPVLRHVYGHVAVRVLDPFKYAPEAVRYDIQPLGCSPECENHA